MNVRTQRPTTVLTACSTPTPDNTRSTRSALRYHSRLSDTFLRAHKDTASVHLLKHCRRLPRWPIEWGKRWSRPQGSRCSVSSPGLRARERRPARWMLQCSCSGGCALFFRNRCNPCIITRRECVPMTRPHWSDRLEALAMSGTWLSKCG